MKIKNFVSFNESLFNNKPLPEIDLDELIPEENVIETFKKYGISVDDKENKINNVQYIDNNQIMCSYTTYSYAGEIPNNISEILNNIKNDLGASNITIKHDHQVIFDFDESEYPELYEKLSNKDSIVKKHKKILKKNSIVDKKFTKKKRKSEDEAIDDKYKENIHRIKRMKKQAAKAFADKSVDITIRNIKQKIKRYEIRIAEKELEILRMRDQKLLFKKELKIAEKKGKNEKRI